MSCRREFCTQQNLRILRSKLKIINSSFNSLISFSILHTFLHYCYASLSLLSTTVAGFPLQFMTIFTIYLLFIISKRMFIFLCKYLESVDCHEQLVVYFFQIMQRQKKMARGWGGGVNMVILLWLFAFPFDQYGNHLTSLERRNFSAIFQDFINFKSFHQDLANKSKRCLKNRDDGASRTIG